MVKREIASMLQRGGTRRRGSEEHRATDLAEEHGFSEADHRACRRARRRAHYRMCALITQEGDEAVQLLVCGMWWPVRLEKSEQKLDLTR